MGHVVNLTEAVTFEREDCCSCGITFFVPAELQSRRLRDAKMFWCPNGHQQHYSTSEADRLRAKVKELEALAQAETKRKQWAEQEAKNQREIAEATQRRLSAQFGENTKLRKRVSNGVCPCCTRSFTNLRRHMATKHPDHAATA